jgi:hypothetical protein
VPIRKCLVLAFGLALAIAALVPAAAVAKEGGTDRPIKGRMSGISVGSLAAGKGTADERGVATHLGRFTFHGDVYVTGFTPPNIAYLGGTFTFKAANGDRLRGTFTETATLVGPAPGQFTGHTGTFVSTFTGGTGRFAHASGTVTGTEVVTLIFRDEDGLAHERIEHTFTGHISY